MSDADWLKNLKVGDEVIIDSSSGARVAAVTRLTPSMVCVRHPTSFKETELQFNRKTGRERGEQAASRFGWRPRLKHGDAAEIQACKDRRERDDLIAKLQHRVFWSKLSLETLRAVDALVTPNAQTTDG